MRDSLQMPLVTTGESVVVYIGANRRDASTLLSSLFLDDDLS